MAQSLASRRINAPFAQEDLHERARALWNTARYDDLIALASETSDPEIVLLAGRANLRLKRVEAAAAAFESVRTKDESLASEASVLAQSARRRLTQPDKSRRIFEAQLPPRASATAKAFACYYSALSAWTANDFDLAEAILRDGSPERVAAVSAMTHDLRGWIDSSRHRHASAARRFLEALAVNDDDQFARATSLHGLVAICVETIDLDLLPKVVGEWQKLGDAPALARQRTGIECRIATAQALAGNDAAAFASLMHARAIPENGPLVALVDTELGAFHRRRGSADAARLHFDAAGAILAAIGWGEADIEMRAIAVLFAALAADVDYASAAKAFTVAGSIDGKTDALLAKEHDFHPQAVHTFARGRLALARGDRAAAESDLRSAAQQWSAIGNHFRAAYVEATLHEAGFATAPDAFSVVKRDAPQSWLSAIAETPQPNRTTIGATLGKAERRIMELICAGYTSKEIAEMVGRSIFTVRNQTIRIYRTFGVRNRVSLMLKVAGETEPTAGAPSDASVDRTARRVGRTNGVRRRRAVNDGGVVTEGQKTGKKSDEKR